MKSLLFINNPFECGVVALAIILTILLLGVACSSLLAKSKKGLSADSQKSVEGKRIPWLAETAVIVVVVGILVSLILPVFFGINGIRSAMHPAPPVATCINNLRMIDSAKEQWALTVGATNGMSVVTNDVNRYLKGSVTPLCPMGGIYSYENIDTNPVCSYLGHELP